MGSRDVEAIFAIRKAIAAGEVAVRSKWRRRAIRLVGAERTRQLWRQYG